MSDFKRLCRLVQGQGATLEARNHGWGRWSYKLKRGHTEVTFHSGSWRANQVYFYGQRIPVPWDDPAFSDALPSDQLVMNYLALMDDPLRMRDLVIIEREAAIVECRRRLKEAEAALKETHADFRQLIKNERVAKRAFSAVTSDKKGRSHGKGVPA